MNKRPIIIICGVMVFLIGAASLLLLLTRQTPNTQTGGSGRPEVGTLFLTGYETPSNDSSKIPLGKFLSSEQEVKIRSSLGIPLYKRQPQQEYRGAVVPGSVNVDYTTNVVQFKVHIQKPDITYTVNYNPVSDEMHILDEKGQEVFKSSPESN